MKILPLISLCLFIFLQTHAQVKGRERLWKAKVILKEVRIKGQLYSVSDSSLKLMIRRHAVDEILFRDILAIKLTPFGNQTTEKIVGLTAGTGLGAWGLSSALSKGKEGEPAAMSGVIGGIGGAVGGGITGFVLVPAIGKLVRTKKIKVSHNDESYFLLKTKLQPYCLKSR